MKLTAVVLSLGLLTLGGCHITNEYSATVDAYVNAESQIQLGMSPGAVARILDPTQRLLDNKDRRRDERYLEGDSEVLIRFYRSGWQADGRLTDDEYTPYVFRDQRLVAVGWQMHRTAML
ncbi:MAG: DUF3192 domain-containing protein [Pseudomonadales bacterium]